MSARDIIVIGASAGGLEPLAEIVVSLPADFPASLFVAQHMEPGFRTRLPELLAGRGKLRASLALTTRPRACATAFTRSTARRARRRAWSKTLLRGQVVLTPEDRPANKDNGNVGKG